MEEAKQNLENNQNIQHTTTQPEEPKNNLKSKINEMSVLAPLLAFYTLFYISMATIDFALKEKIELPEGLETLYIALLGAYALDKEVRRWIDKPEPPRKGTIFVYMWMILYAAFYLIHTFAPQYQMPPYMLSVCLQVLGIFFGSKASKYIHSKVKAPEESEDYETELESRKKIILELIQQNGYATRQMICEKLNISSTTARRILRKMQEEQLIAAEGTGRSTRYVAEK